MDRRWSTRKYLSLDVHLEVPSYNKILTGTLLDLSLGGAFIETEALLPSNAPLTVELKLPGILAQNTFRLNARVVRRNPGGSGMAFVGMSAGVIHALSEALSQYELRLEPLQSPVLAPFVMGAGLVFKSCGRPDGGLF